MIKDLLENRRSIRKYKQDKVDLALVKDLLKHAGRTSTCGNMQLYSVVLTDDKTVLEKLAPAHFCQPASTSAPMIVTFCADYNRFSKWCKLSGAEPGYDNFESFISAAVDTIALAQTFSMLAEESGLGICYLGTTTYNPELVADALELPELVVPLVSLSVGYPDENPALTDRIESDGWIHENAYKDYSNSDIHRIFDYKDELDENKKFVAENGKRNIAQVFTDIRYTKQANEEFSTKLIDFLKRQNFLD